MAAQIIDGRGIAAEIRKEIRKEVDSLKEAGCTPGLAVVLVGEDPASASYVRSKERACEKMGIYTETLRMSEHVSQEEVLGAVRDFNSNPEFHGILVQLPLPGHVDESTVIEAVSPDKDVDGFHPQNIGRMVLGTPKFIPATPAGILELLTRTGVEVEGKDVVIVGRSNIVGKPLANLLMQRSLNATVTVCHTRTKDLNSHTRTADILVAAAGSPQVITSDMVKEGAVVVDVGVNRVDDPQSERGYRIVGDVDFDSVAKVASAITPVPGGVGPMTVTMLLKNTVQAARDQMMKQDARRQMPDAR